MVLTKKDVDEIVKMLLINNQKALQGYVIGSLYFKIGEFPAALKYVSRYLGVWPHSFVAWKLQGECYEKLNRVDEALKSYQKAIDSEKRKRNAKRQGVDSESIEEINGQVSTGKSEIQNSSSTITSEAAISHKDNNYVNETCSEVTFKFTVTHITTLDCFACSQSFPFQNLSWKIIVAPRRDRGPNRSLSFYLLCNGGSDSTMWSCNVNAEFRLLSVKLGKYPHVQKLRHSFNREEDAWGFLAFISWNNVVCPDGNYIEDDCITVEVYLTVLD